MSGDYVTRHVRPRSSELDPENIYIYPVSPDLTSKSSRDSIVHLSRQFFFTVTFTFFYFIIIFICFYFYIYIYLVLFLITAYLL